MSSVKSIFNLIKFKMPKKYDRMIHLSVIVLILLGTLMIISTSVGETYESKLVVIKTTVKQFGFITVAYFCMINVASYFSLERIFKYIKAIGIVILGMMFICLAFEGAGGAKSWIYLSIPFIGIMSTL